MGGEIGRPSNVEIDDRRKEIKEYMLKNTPVTTIAKKVGVSPQTVRKDIAYWQSYYKKLAIKNPHIVQRQFAKVEELIDEVQIIKTKYWSLFEELEGKAEQANVILNDWYAERDRLVKEYEDAKTAGEAKAELKELAKNLKRHGTVPPRVNSFYTARLDTLKTVMQRIEQEAKLLNLLNPTNLLQESYISKDIFKNVMEIFKTIILDLIPEEKQRYAFSRLQKVQLDEAEDAELVVKPKMIEEPEVEAELEEEVIEEIETIEEPEITNNSETEESEKVVSFDDLIDL